MHHKLSSLCTGRQGELDQEKLVLDIGKIEVCSAGKENDTMLETIKQHLEK